MRQHWNSIKFKEWKHGELSLVVTEWDEDPIILILNGDYHSLDLMDYMTAPTARELAGKLVEAADAADKAGKHGQVPAI